VSNTKDISEKIVYRFNYDKETSKERKECYEKKIIEQLDASFFWLNFTKFDIVASSAKEAIGSLMSYDSGLKVIMRNMFVNKTLGTDNANIALVIFQPFFDKKVYEITQDINFRYYKKEMDYIDEILTKPTTLDINVTVIDDNSFGFECKNIPNTGIFAYKKSRIGPNNEQYFGEKEYRYLFIGNPAKCNKECKYIEFPRNGYIVADIPIFKNIKNDVEIDLQNLTLHKFKEDGTYENV
jgi:hypothetical protein